MTLASFRDFEDYEFLNNYQDFKNEENVNLRPITPYNDVHEQLMQCGIGYDGNFKEAEPTIPSMFTFSSPSPSPPNNHDVIFSELWPTCRDFEDYEFLNNYQDFKDFKDEEKVNLHPITQYNDVHEQLLQCGIENESYPYNDCSFNDVEPTIPSIFTFSSPSPPPRPPNKPDVSRELWPKAPTPVKRKKEISPSAPLPKPMIIRSPANSENVVLSFPEPVQFIMNKKEPIVPGSPDKRLFRYTITSDSVAVNVEQKTSTKSALKFLKDIHIKALPSSSAAVVSPNKYGNHNEKKQTVTISAGTSTTTKRTPKKQQQQQQQQPKQPKSKSKKRPPKIETIPIHVPTVLIGTQGQIKRAVKRQGQQHPPQQSSSSLSLSTSSSSSSTSSQPGSLQTSPVLGFPMHTQQQQQQHHQQYNQPQITLYNSSQRRVVLLPNLSKLSRFNFSMNNNAGNSN